MNPRGPGHRVSAVAVVNLGPDTMAVAILLFALALAARAIAADECERSGGHWEPDALVGACER